MAQSVLTHSTHSSFSLLNCSLTPCDGLSLPLSVCLSHSLLLSVQTNHSFILQSLSIRSQVIYFRVISFECQTSSMLMWCRCDAVLCCVLCAMLELSSAPIHLIFCSFCSLDIELTPMSYVLCVHFWFGSTQTLNSVIQLCSYWWPLSPCQSCAWALVML